MITRHFVIPCRIIKSPDHIIFQLQKQIILKKMLEKCKLAPIGIMYTSYSLQDLMDQLPKYSLLTNTIGVEIIITVK